MGTAAPSSEPSSLHKSVACLYGSPHLGVFLAHGQRIVDANDTFLKMIGFTRPEMLADAIDWWALTAPEYRPQDLNAMEQMREYGACVPYEKEYILRDGTRLRFMIGAVGLTTEPAAAKLVNRLAHELK